MQDRARELTRIFVDNIAPMLMNRESIQAIFGKTSEFTATKDLQFRTNRRVFGDLF